MKKIISILFLLIILGLSNKSLAVGKVLLITDNKEILQGETFEVSIKIEDISISAMQLEVIYDTEKLEFVSSSEGSNNINNRIIFSWFDENGGNTPKQSGEVVASFSLKAKQEGTSTIAVGGEFYDKNGKIIETQNDQMEITIRSKQKKTTDENNSKLQSLRLNHEGMSPYFENDVTDYYFIANNNIDSLEVTAIPEEDGAEVKITGNTGLKMGINTINIEVKSPNKKNITNYTIIVTKTTNEKGANTNLETLAVENSLLYPSFDNNITNYNIEVDNDTESLNILAIPENMKASATIQGKDNLKIGDNTITITVKAEDNISVKKYIITAHRRSQEEQIKEEEENKNQAERLSALLTNTVVDENLENIELEQNEEEEKNGIINVIIVIIAGLVCVVIAIVISRKRGKVLKK